MARKRRLTSRPVKKAGGLPKPILPKILALDLGSKLGWAVTFSDGGFASGCKKLVKASTKKHKETPGMRFVRFKEFLEGLTGVNAVFYEEVHAHAGTDAAHCYGGFRALLFTWAEEHKIPYSSFGVGTIKKHATDRGNAKKDEMIAAANRLYGKELGKEITDDNEADALCILNLALHTLSKKV